mmetsp:Transcript_5316/g.11557  ORF Transcript_5316/g.11557 Transcript_5316/m.11557 type:complete len:86 (+) Transcript_5316:3-260(+)
MLECTCYLEKNCEASTTDRENAAAKGTLKAKRFCCQAILLQADNRNQVGFDGKAHRTKKIQGHTEGGCRPRSMVGRQKMRRPLSA